MIATIALVASVACLVVATTFAQAPEQPCRVDIASPAIYVGDEELVLAEAAAGRLSHSAAVTFTPAYTAHLPLALKGFVGCSTAPMLLSPANDRELDTIAPLFRWDNGSNPSATRSRLQVAEDADFKRISLSLSTGATGVMEFRFYVNLKPAATYYWRAWLQCGDQKGPYSQVWSFTTGSGGTILPAPTLISPSDGGTVSKKMVTLEWAPVSGAVEYVVHYRPAGEPGHIFYTITDTHVTRYFADGATYEWWVSARNDYANGDDSVTWQFTVPEGSPLRPPEGHDQGTEAVGVDFAVPEPQG